MGSGAVQVWDAESGRPLFQLITGQQDREACFTHDGSRMVTAGDSVHFWDVATGAEQRTLKGHEDQVFAVAFSPDGKLLVSAGASDGARL